MNEHLCTFSITKRSGYGMLCSTGHDIDALDDSGGIERTYRKDFSSLHLENGLAELIPCLR